MLHDAVAPQRRPPEERNSCRCFPALFKVKETVAEETLTYYSERGLSIFHKELIKAIENYTIQDEHKTR